MEIRLYTPTYYHEVVRLWNKAGLILSLSDTKEELNRLYRYNSNSFFLLFANQDLVGAVVGSFDGRRGFIHHLAVDPKYQGRGLGKLLMDHLMDYFEQRDVVKVHLMIERTNADVKKFYQHLGWVERTDLILMSKTLREDSINTLEDRVVKDSD